MSPINLPAARQIRRSSPFPPPFPFSRIPRAGPLERTSFPRFYRGETRQQSRKRSFQRSMILAAINRLSRQRFARGIRFLPERDSNLLENSMRFPPCIQGAFIYQRRLAVHSDPRVLYPSRDIEAGSPRWIVARRGRLDICRDGRQQITSQLLVWARPSGCLVPSTPIAIVAYQSTYTRIESPRLRYDSDGR